MRDEYVHRGKGDLYDVLKDSLAWNSAEVPCAELGERLGMTESAIRVALHRMRKRYRELVLREIERTVESPEDVADETMGRWVQSVNALLGLFRTLGLRRQVKTVDLKDYVAERYG